MHWSCKRYAGKCNSARKRYAGKCNAYRRSQCMARRAPSSGVTSTSHALVMQALCRKMQLGTQALCRKMQRVQPENATRTDTLPLRGATSSGAGGRYAPGGSVQAADQFAWAVSGLARAIIKTLTHIKCGGTRSGRRFASARRVGRPPAGLPQRRVHWGALPRQPHARGTVYLRLSAPANGAWRCLRSASARGNCLTTTLSTCPW
jgi:hypothetical protein